MCIFCSKVLTLLYRPVPLSGVDVIAKFAQLEFRYGDAERGRTMFDKVLTSYPKRTDLWSVFIDLMVKHGSQKDVRWAHFASVNSCNTGYHQLILKYDHLSLAGSFLIAWSIWVFRWKRSNSSSSATWSTRRSMAPRRASRQSKRRPWSLSNPKVLKLPNDDQIHISNTCGRLPVTHRLL